MSTIESQEFRVAEYRYNRHLIIGRFYGNERRAVRRAARAFDEAGWGDVYPTRETSITRFPSGYGGYGYVDGIETNVFYFLGNERHATYPAQIQADVFEQMNNLRISGKVCYVAIHKGYIGESTGIEVAYALMLGVPIILAESGEIRFSDKVPPDIKAIIEKNIDKYPVLPVKAITADTLSKAQRIARAVNPPKMTNEEVVTVKNEAIKLVQRLSFDYPDFYDPDYKRILRNR